MLPDQRAVLRALLPGPLSVPELVARLQREPFDFWHQKDITRERIESVLRRLRDAGLAALDGAEWRALPGAADAVNKALRVSAMRDVLARKAEMGAV